MVDFKTRYLCPISQSLFPMSHSEILEKTRATFKQLDLLIAGMSDDDFFKNPTPGKWSAAEQVQHLSLSLKMTSLALKMPKIILGLAFGKNKDGQSLSYQELEQRYKDKLAKGAKASGPYVPKNLPSRVDILEEWKKQSSRYLKALEYRWDDTKLSTYRVMHPILGKMPVKSLVDFTDFHTLHHVESMAAALDLDKAHG